MEAILIPVKRFSLAKLRLSNRLSADERQSLGMAMLADVLAAVGEWTMRFIVSDEPEFHAFGDGFGCKIVKDPGEGLNPAIQAGTRAAIKAGADSLVVLPCDVPLVTESDIDRLFSSTFQVAIAESPDGGTNALMRRPPGAVEPAFGAQSAHAHRRAATQAGLDAATLDLPSLRLDVDGYEDLRQLGSLQSNLQSVRLAAQLTTRHPGAV